MKKIEELYTDFLKSKKRKKKETTTYRPSSAGRCGRMIYYESIMKPEPTNLPNGKSLRLMHLGSIVHNDIQSSIVEYLLNKEKEAKRNI